MSFERPWDVAWLPHARQVTAEVGRLARSHGLWADFRATIEVIHVLLRYNAESWGEALYDLRFMQAQVRVGAYGLLYVNYGVQAALGHDTVNRVSSPLLGGELEDE